MYTLKRLAINEGYYKESSASSARATSLDDVHALLRKTLRRVLLIAAGVLLAGAVLSFVLTLTIVGAILVAILSMVFGALGAIVFALLAVGPLPAALEAAFEGR